MTYFKPHKTTEQLISEYNDNNFRWEGYDLCYRLRMMWMPHFNGTYMEYLIGDKYPSENQEVRKWRMDNIQYITKSYLDRIINTIQKLRYNPELQVIYTDDVVEKYCNIEFPFYDTFNNYLFTILLKQWLVDPNGVLVWLPYGILEQDKIPPENYSKPYPYFFSSDKVLYKDGYNFFIKLDNKYTLVVGQFSTYIIYPNQYKKGYITTKLLTYNFDGFTPAFTLTGNWYETIDGQPVYESFLSSTLPFLNLSLIMFSDIQIMEKNHAYPLQWIYNDNKCSSCNGTGFTTHSVDNFEDYTSPCKSCAGRGYSVSPSHYIEIHPSKSIDQKDIPIPPAGYIERDLEPLIYMNKEYKFNLSKSLSSVHMEFLDDVNLDTSGVSKEFDRLEFDSFMKTMLDNFVDNIWSPSLYFITAYLGKNLKELPSFRVPTNFTPNTSNILTKNNGQTSLETLQGSTINSLVKNNLRNVLSEIDYKWQELIMDTDPLPGLSTDNKLSLLKDNIVNKDNVRISVNIDYLMSLLVDKNNLEDINEFMNIPKQNRINSLEVLLESTIEKEIIENEPTKIIQENTEPLNDEGGLLTN